MNTVTHQLPLPGGVRFSAPSRRARVDVWAAPDPASLVLDPWAAPVGEPIARTRLSPWPAPSPMGRIAWMAAPAALLPPPSPIAAVRAEAAKSADRALATLRTLADAPRRSALAPPEATSEVRSAIDVLEPSWATSSTFDPPITSARVDAAERPSVQPAPVTDDVATDRQSNVVRWRAIAIVSGIGAAAAAAVTLLAAVL